MVVKADPILKLVSDCKFWPIEGMIPTWNLEGDQVHFHAVETKEVVL
jgi:hypothetical protein